MKRQSDLLEKWIYWWERRSLQSRLISAYIIIILVPSLLVSVLSFQAINQTYIKDTINKNKNLLEMEKLHIQNQIESMERSAQIARSDNDVLNYLTSNSELSLGELVDFNMNAFVNLTRIQFNNPNIEHIRLFTDNDYTHEIWPIIFKEERIKDEPWYEQTFGLGDRQMWYFQEDDPDLMNGGQSPVLTDQPKISLLREISVVAGEHSGIIQVDMLLPQFSPKIFAYTPEQEAQLFLIDSNKDIYTRREHSLFAYYPDMERAILEQFAKDSGPEGWQMEYSEGGNSFLWISIPLERMDAHLLNVVSMEEVLREISVIRNKTIGANVLFIVLFTIIAYVLNAFILKNLVRLTDAVKKARRGELYTGVAIRGGGEIAELTHHFNKLMNKINELVAVAVRKEASTKEAELRTLHNQIDSHFLYNTLENIKMLAEIENQREISDALTSLGGMMRYNFQWSGEYVKLKDEIRHIQNYIEVMNIRFDEPIQLTLEIPPRVMELEVLKMSLQPIVENSVKHGWSQWEEAPGPKQVQIQAELGAKEFCISIIDNGQGMEEEELMELHRRMQGDLSEPRPENIALHARRSSSGSGIGLLNVNQRLKLYYGSSCRLEVSSIKGVHTTVRMTLPRGLLTGGAADETESADRG